MENTTEQTLQPTEVVTPQTEPVQTVEQPQPQAETVPEQAPEPAPQVEFPKPFELPTETPKDPLDELPLEKIAERYKGKEEALLKAFGLDDFALGAINYYKQTGSLAEYAEVKSVDYTKMPDSAVVERKLREQYAAQGLNEDELKLLIEDEMQHRYKLDPEQFSEREVQLGKIRMKADASEYRSTFIDRQSKFKAPDRTPVQDQPQLTYEQQVEMQRNELLQQQPVQQFLKASKLQFGDPYSPYNYEVSKPQEVAALLYDPNFYTYHVAQKTSDGKVMTNQQGQPVLDHAKMLKVAAYVKDMENIEKQLINYGKTLGKKEVIVEAENPVDTKTHGTTPEPDDLLSALHRKLMNR